MMKLTPMTCHRLRARAWVRFLTLLVLPLLTVPAQVEPDPDRSARHEILLRMRQYAATYRMPDVAFDLRLTHFRAPLGSENWPEWSNDQKRIAHHGYVYLCCATR